MNKDENLLKYIEDAVKPLEERIEKLENELKRLKEKDVIKVNVRDLASVSSASKRLDLKRRLY